MMNELLTIDYNSLGYQDAMKLHTQILTSGSVAASALVDMCQSLKKMRDGRQYIHLGYHDFDEYVVSACRMKARQAYTYISTIERLGTNVLESNANLGITKLALLSSVSDDQRDEILVNNDVEDMSTRELQALTDELTKAREQISLLEDAKTSAAEGFYKETGSLAMEKQHLLDKIEKLEAEKDELIHTEQVENADEIKAIRAEKENAIAAADKAIAEKDAAVAAAVQANAIKIDNAWKDKVKAVKEKAIADAKKEADAEVIKARQDGIEAGKKAAQQGLEAVEREKAEALARAQELEKKLSISGNSETVLFAHLFNELQNDYNKLLECYKRIADKDPEAGKKYGGAVRKAVLEIMPSLAPTIEE